MGKENPDENFSCVLVRISRQAIKITSVINIIFLEIQYCAPRMPFLCLAISNDSLSP